MLTFLAVVFVVVLAGVLCAAPTPTARTSPTGIKLPDGYQSKITIAADVDINLFERTTRPPGIDGGEPIEQTTMFNTSYRTFAARQLQTLTATSYKCAYDPQVITELLAVINRNTTITQSFFDGSTLAYYGYVQKVDFDELAEGALPMCTVTIVPTNFDPANRVEAGPVVTSVSGS